ncbi:Uncharacterised protein [Yersinia aleksiciae]|uniref:Uncharacterized protein n=1 Tax=Yersinia aleksiciae TaxID=263819 RepID=A0A0T9UKV1_YERAE|nr:Uncharacterised protein [Yersinia aleksiciae]CNL49571.1 Uncharacterised protein [Yersinia aleksiciae]
MYTYLAEFMYKTIVILWCDAAHYYFYKMY